MRANPVFRSKSGPASLFLYKTPEHAKIMTGTSKRPRSFAVGMLAAVIVLGSLVAALSAGAFNPWLFPPDENPIAPTVYDPLAIAAEPDADQRAAPSDWPQLFGPLLNNRVPPARDVSFDWQGDAPEIAWKNTIGTGYSSPVISAGRCIVLHRLGDEEVVSCFDLQNGETVWERRYPTAYECPHPPHSSGPYSTPLIEGDRVYVQGADGLFQCLSLDNGEPYWSRQLSEEYAVPENVFAVGHSPALDGDQLILNIGAKERNAGIIAIDKLTGETRWEATSFGASYATPALATIDDQKYCFVLTAEAAVALDPADGRVFWEFPHKAIAEDFVNATSPVVAGDVVIFTAYQAGTVYSRVLPDGSREEIRHDKRNLVSQFNPLTVQGDFLYGWHFMDKSFRCIELATGEVRWKWVSGIGRGTHAIANDSILLYGESGKIAVAAPNTEELIVLHEATEPLLKEPAFSAPAVAEKRVLLRNEEEIICLDFSGSQTDSQ